MTVVTVHKAKTELSKLIARAEAGEEIIIARGNKPAVRLVPVAQAPKPPRQPGAWKGQFEFPDDFFFDPLPEEELKAWEGAGFREDEAPEKIEPPTLDLDADILQAAQELAARRGTTAGQIISDLVRKSLSTREGVEEPFEIVDGIPVLPNKGGIVTNEMVEQLLYAADLEDGKFER